MQDTEQTQQVPNTITTGHLLSLADSHAASASTLIAASSALTNARQQLKKKMDMYESVFQSTQHDSPQYIHATMEIENSLLNLTNCRTFYTMKTLQRENYINFNSDEQPKYGIKPAMKYTQGRHLLSLSTASEGRHYDWKMDFQATFTHTDEKTSHDFPNKVKDELDLQELFRQVGNRLEKYRAYLQTKEDYRQQIRRAPGHVQPKSLQTLMTTLHNAFDHLSAANNKMMNNPTKITRFHQNSVKMDFHWQDNMHDAQQASVHVPDMDADVQHNPYERDYIYLEDQETRVKIEVVHHFAYRRQWGMHVELENKKTIDFINKMLPHVGGGWFEIIVSAPDMPSYKIHLTPWERPSTTFVRPFSMIATDSPLWSMNYQPGGDTPFEYRDLEPSRFRFKSYEPYLIYGKGNEIDGMVHTLRTLEKVDQDYQELCENIRLFIDEFSNPVNRVSYMRAYYSTDDARAGNLGSVGDRSIFFFNVQGVVLGVEMSSPSLPPHVNYLKHSRTGWLPRNAGQHNVPAEQVLPQPPPAAHGHQQAVHWSVNAPQASRLVQLLHEMKGMMGQLNRELHQAEQMVYGGGGGGGGGGRHRHGNPMRQRVHDLDPVFEGTDPRLQYTPHVEYVDARLLLNSSLNNPERPEWRDSLTPHRTEWYGFSVPFQDAKKIPISLFVRNLPIPRRESAALQAKGADHDRFDLNVRLYREHGYPMYKHETENAYFYLDVVRMQGCFQNAYVWALRIGDEHYQLVTSSGLSLCGAEQAFVDLQSFQTSGEEQKKIEDVEIYEASADADAYVEYVDSGYTEGKMLKITWRRGDSFHLEEMPRNVLADDAKVPCPVKGSKNTWYVVRCHQEFGDDAEKDFHNVLSLHLRIIASVSYVRDEVAHTLSFMCTAGLNEVDMPRYYGLMSGYLYIRYNGQTHKERIEDVGLYIEPYWDHQDNQFTWGIKIPYKLTGFSKFIAYKKIRNAADGRSMPSALITSIDDGSWVFFKDHEWSDVQMTDCDVTIEKVQTSEEPENRVGFHAQGKSAREIRKEDEEYKAPKAMAIVNAYFKAVNHEMRRQAIEVMDEYYKNGIRGRFALHVMTKKHMKSMNEVLEGKNSPMRVTPFKVPGWITVTHKNEYLNLGIVNLQGPVYMSDDGLYLVAPHVANDVKLERDFATWGIYVWQKWKIGYDLLAYKINAENNSLFSDVDGTRLKNSQWRMFREWGTSAVIEYEDAYARDAEIISVLPAMRDHSLDCFQLFPRYPDYTVSEREIEQVKDVKDLRHGPLSAHFGLGAKIEDYVEDEDGAEPEGEGGAESHGEGGAEPEGEKEGSSHNEMCYIASVHLCKPPVANTPWTWMMDDLHSYIGNMIMNAEYKAIDQIHMDSEAAGTREGAESVRGFAGDDDDDAFLLRQCFDLDGLARAQEPPARLPQRPRKLASALRGAAPTVPLEQQNQRARRGPRPAAQARGRAAHPQTSARPLQTFASWNPCGHRAWVACSA